ncbi:MAG: hypothetical protein SGCHY_001738 [Lobulomycetales sp.]
MADPDPDRILENVPVTYSFDRSSKSRLFPQFPDAYPIDISAFQLDAQTDDTGTLGLETYVQRLARARKQLETTRARRIEEQRRRRAPGLGSEILLPVAMDTPPAAATSEAPAVRSSLGQQVDLSEFDPTSAPPDPWDHQQEQQSKGTSVATQLFQAMGLYPPSQYLGTDDRSNQSKPQPQSQPVLPPRPPPPQHQSPQHYQPGRPPMHHHQCQHPAPPPIAAKTLSPQPPIPPMQAVQPEAPVYAHTIPSVPHPAPPPIPQKPQNALPKPQAPSIPSKTRSTGRETARDMALSLLCKDVPGAVAKDAELMAELCGFSLEGESDAGRARTVKFLRAIVGVREMGFALETPAERDKVVAALVQSDGDSALAVDVLLRS